MIKECVFQKGRAFTLGLFYTNEKRLLELCGGDMLFPGLFGFGGFFFAEDSVGV
jgi:hypothetical protein